MKGFSHEFMLVGLDSKISYSDCNLLELQGKEAESFINGERSDCSREYFVDTHGIRPVPKNFLQKIFNQPSEYLLSSPNWQIPVHRIISKLIKNHPTEKSIPVIHLFACFSGAAQDHLAKISGDVILCTYTHSDKAHIVGFGKSFIKLRTSANNLANYINNNFYLCAAVDFTISCKIGNKIFKHKINSELVTATTDVDKMALYLEKEQGKFQRFCQDLNKTFKKNHFETPTKSFPLIPADFKSDKVLVSSNMALIVATANQGSTDVIKNLLSKVKIVPGMAFSIALEENSEALDIFLEYDPNQVTSSSIDQAIRYNFDALAKLLACKADAISESNLRTAIKAKKADELQLLLKYAKDCAKSMDVLPLCDLTTDPVMIDGLKNYAAQVNHLLTQAVASTVETSNSLTIGNLQKSPALLITPPTSPGGLIVDN